MRRLRGRRIARIVRLVWGLGRRVREGWEAPGWNCICRTSLHQEREQDINIGLNPCSISVYRALRNGRLIIHVRVSDSNNVTSVNQIRCKMRVRRNHRRNNSRQKGREKSEEQLEAATEEMAETERKGEEHSNVHGYLAIAFLRLCFPFFANNSPAQA